MAAAASPIESAPHIPVLIGPILRAIAPVEGTWLDGTFGAGGYTRAFLEAGAERVIAVDRDPLAFEMAAHWACLLYTSPSPRDLSTSRMPSSA